MVRRFLFATLLVAASCLFVARAYGVDVDAYGQPIPGTDQAKKSGPGSADPKAGPDSAADDSKIPAGAAGEKADAKTLKAETENAQLKANVLKIAALGAAGWMIYQGVTTPPPMNYSFFLAAIPLVNQALKIENYQDSSKGDADKTIGNTTSDKPGTPNFVAENIEPNSPNYPPPGFRTTKELLKIIGDKGIKVKGNQTTLPNGKTVSTSSLGTSSGLAAAGYDGSAAKQAQDIYEVEKEKAELSLAKNSKNKGDDVGSSGGGRYTGNSQLAEESDSSAMSWQTRSAPKRGIASVAGASIKLGSDNIGVSADNIFQMVQRRYNQKRQLKQFIE